MADKTGIAWTDATWNPIVGCSVLSAGCKHCYAMREAARLERMGGKVGEKYAGLTMAGKAGPVWIGAVRLHEASLDQPLRWKRPRRIFVNSMSDLAHEALPFGALMRIWDVMWRAWPMGHVLQVLTKRPQRLVDFAERWADSGEEDHEPRLVTGPAAIRQTHRSGRGGLFADMLDTMGTPPAGCAYPFYDWAGGMRWWPAAAPHILLGATVENQATADDRREPMRRLAELGWRVWVSYEPALGPVDWSGWEFLSWLVCGGESGTEARPMHPDWARSARDWCAAAGVPFFFKQWSEWGAGFDCVEETRATPKHLLRYFPEMDRTFARVGKKAAGRLLDGMVWDERPAR